MVRPDRIASLRRVDSCWIELAGESPVAVSAVAPRSRLRACRETGTSEWSVESPPGAVGLQGGEQVRRPSIKRTLQPREISPRKGEVAEPLMSRRRQQTAPENGPVQDASGVWRRACGHSSMRNRRDPSRRSVRDAARRVTSSDEGDPYKPMAKGDRAGRESEGFVVPWTPVEKAGRGKGPCFGHGCVWR
jgi:hypothetical protein